MNELTKIGKKRTILISISILLVSIHTIYYYHAIRPEIEVKKLIQQIIRFLLTLGLLYAVYKGYKWAKNILLALYSLAAFMALIAIVSIDSTFVNKVPLLVMTFVYSVAIYHFGFDKSFKAFYEYQNRKANAKNS